MHATISIEIPLTLTDAVTDNLGERDLARWGQEALVTSAVGEALISTGLAAEFLHLGYFEMLALLKERHIPSSMTEEDLMSDQAGLKILFPDLFPQRSLSQTTAMWPFSLRSDGSIYWRNLTARR